MFMLTSALSATKTYTHTRARACLSVCFSKFIHWYTRQFNFYPPIFPPFHTFTFLSSSLYPCIPLSLLFHSIPRSTLLPPLLFSPLHPLLPRTFTKGMAELRQTCFSRQSWIVARDSLSLHSELPVGVNGGQEAAVLGSGGRVGLGGEAEWRVRDFVGAFSCVIVC